MKVHYFIIGTFQLKIRRNIIKKIHCNQQLKAVFEESHTKQLQNVISQMFCAGFKKDSRKGVM